MPNRNSRLPHHHLVRRHVAGRKPPLRLSLACALACGSAVLVGCGVDDQVHQAALRDLATQKQLAADRDRQLQAQEEKLAALAKQIEALEAERTQALGGLADAKKSAEDMARARAQAEARAAQFRTLVSKFQKMMAAGKLNVEIRDNRMIVSMGDKILFDPGKTELKKEGAETLAQVTKILKEVDGRDFQIAGHTDAVPIRSARYRSNWDLSAARAVEVVNVMIKNGMEAKRLSAAGYGAEAPIASNEKPDERAKNRRIEITLMPNLDELPPMSSDLQQVAASDQAAASTSPTPEAAPATAIGADVAKADVAKDVKAAEAAEPAKGTEVPTARPAVLPAKP